MSNSVRPHRRQPTRLPRPWDSPDKNPGVGCHFPLQCTQVKNETEVTQPCPIPSDPMDCSPPGSSIHGIFQARVQEWGAIAFSKGSSPPTQGSRLQTPGQEGPASALHKSPKLWLNRLPLRLAQLPNGQEFTARSPQTLILFFPHGCPAGPQTMKALWQSEFKLHFP